MLLSDVPSVDSQLYAVDLKSALSSSIFLNLEKALFRDDMKLAATSSELSIYDFTCAVFRHFCAFYNISLIGTTFVSSSTLCTLNLPRRIPIRL